MDKFGRNYLLRIATENRGPFDLSVTLPFTVEFDITRNNLSSAGVAQIRIYNLSEKTRNLIRHDSCDYGSFKAVELRAGYGTNLVTIFSGNITTASSVREGVNFITTLECLDGGFAYVNGVVNLPPFPAGTLIRTVIETIAASGLPNVTIGAIGDYPGTISRATAYTGNTMYVLNQLTSGGAYIDSGKFYALGMNEYVAGLSSVGVISAGSGLLNTPVLQQNIMHFEMLFEPGLQIGQQVFLDSITAPKSVASSAKGNSSLSASNFNGQYKIISVKHRGVISDAVCGSCTTEGAFFFPIKQAPVGGIT